MSDIYPPRDEWDIVSYPDDDVVAGYREHSLSDPFPGENRAPGYRWGWQNAQKDKTGACDGFEHVRLAFIRMMRHPQ